MRRASLSSALLLLVLSGASCSRCGKLRAGPPERFVRAGAPGVLLLLPSLGTAATRAGELARRLSAHPSAAELVTALNQVKTQLGFDPLDPKALSKAGFDPDGAAALFAGRAGVLLVLPVANGSRFDSTVSRLARDLEGAGLRKTVRLPTGKELVLFQIQGEGAPSLGYLVTEGQAILMTGADAERVLTEAAALPAEQSLVGNGSWKAARAALGEGQAAVLFAGPEAMATAPGVEPAGSRLLRDGAAVGIGSSGTRLTVRAAVLLSPGREKYWLGIAGGSASAARSAGLAELARLDPGAPVAVRWGGDFASLGSRLVPKLPPDLADTFRKGGIDLERDLFQNLRPGAVLSLALSPNVKVAELAEGGEPDLLRVADLVIRARVRDPAKVRALLEGAGRAAARMGGTIAPRPMAGGASAWTIRYGPLHPGGPGASGKFTCILQGEELSLFAGPGEPALDRPAHPPGGGGAAAQPALKNGIGAAAVDFDRLAASIQALPEEAFGTGPMSVVMSSMAAQIAQSASSLRWASLNLDLTGGAAIVDLAVEWKEGAQKAP